MLKIVTGKPGSGKTYYLIREILGKYYKYDEEFHEWRLKDGVKVTIFTNIKGLKLPHIKLDSYLRQCEITLREFFTLEFYEQVSEKYGQTIVILDEAQSFFNRDFKETNEAKSDIRKNCHYFFEYHRHLGVDLYLAAQLFTRLCPTIAALAEYQINARPKTRAVLNELVYDMMDYPDILSTKRIRPDKKIFPLYKTVDVTEENKGSEIRPVRKILILSAIGLCAVIGWFRLSYGTPEKPISSTSEPAAVAAAEAGTAKPPPAPSRTTSSFSAEPVVAVQPGVLWLGDLPHSVQIFGKVYRYADLPYMSVIDAQRQKVTVYVPRRLYDEFLAAIPIEIIEN